MLGSLGYGIIECYHRLIHCASALIINDYVLIKCTYTGYVPQQSFSGATLAMGFVYMLVTNACALFKLGSVLIFQYAHHWR